MSPVQYNRILFCYIAAQNSQTVDNIKNSKKIIWKPVHNFLLRCILKDQVSKINQLILPLFVSFSYIYR